MNYNRHLTIPRQGAYAQNILCPKFTVTGDINTIVFKREEASTEVYIQTWGLDSQGNAVRGEILVFPIGLYENVARANAPIMYGEILKECNYTMPAIVLLGQKAAVITKLVGTGVNIIEDDNKRYLQFTFSRYSSDNGKLDSKILKEFLLLLYNGDGDTSSWLLEVRFGFNGSLFRFNTIGLKNGFNTYITRTVDTGSIFRFNITSFNLNYRRSDFSILTLTRTSEL